MARQSNKKYAICNAIPGGQPFGLQPVASPSPSPSPCPSPIQNRGRVAGGGNVFLPPPAINCAGISLCQGRFLNEVPKLGLVSWQALDVELVFGHRFPAATRTKIGEAAAKVVVFIPMAAAAARVPSRRATVTAAATSPPTPPPPVR